MFSFRFTFQSWLVHLTEINKSDVTAVSNCKSLAI